MQKQDVHPFVADILSRPLALRPGVLGLMGEWAPNPIRAEKASRMDEWGLGALYVDRRGSVAVVSVFGMLVFRGGLLGWCFGCCDTYALAGAFYDLAQDDTIDRVVVVFDTPGGDTYGIDAVVDAMRAVKEAGKGLIGVVIARCYSGGVWLLAQCGERYAAPLAGLGAIGIFSVLEDSSELFAEMGVKRILVSSTELKGINIPGIGISEVQAAAEESPVMALHRRFIADVAEGTGQSEKVVQGWAESPNMIGDEAVRAGLAHGVSTLERVLEDAVAA